MSKAPVASREIELKFDVTEDQLARLRDKPFLKELSFSGPSHSILRSIYYDTANRLLKAKGISLRVRQVGDTWVQTLKAGRGVVAGMSKPLELEWPVSRARLDLEPLGATEIGVEFEELLRNAKLRPVFETIVSRTTNQVRAADGSHLEIAFDDGKVQAGDSSKEIHEVEIELKSGHPSSLFGVAEKLAAGEALRFSTMTKADRGYRVVDGEVPKLPEPTRYHQPELAPNCSVEDVFRSLLQSSSVQISQNWKVVLDTTDIEGPHQLRIGLRRLRSVLKAFRPVVAAKRVRILEQEAQGIAALVGELRDIDVLVAEIVASAIKTFPDDEALVGLRRYLNSRRKKIRKNIVAELAGDRVVLFLLRLGQMTEAPKWRSRLGEPNRLSAAYVAGPALERSWSRAARWGSRIVSLSVPERHSMRKALKQLRYQCEAFESFYPGRQIKPFLKKLKHLLDVFGYLNDVAMAEKLSHIEIAADIDNTELQRAIGSVLGWHTAQSDRAWRKAHGSWRSLEKSAGFWMA